jgi:FAD binding domain-containing protein/berberine-like enzyme
MSGTELVNTSGTLINEDIIGAFREEFSGPLIRPNDPGYHAARSVWNASVDKRPGLIARCKGLADVVAAVNFARENELLAAIRGGGHNVGGRALCDGGIVIDQSLLTAVFVDPTNLTVRAHGGVTLGQLDRETHVHGLTVPIGVVSGTGIAGLTLGGGVGWLSRKYGMTIDNLLSCEVVTAAGEVLTASEHTNPDLFWALRGGGGNFGVVTSFEYRAHPVSTVLAGFVVHHRSAATDLLRLFRDFTRSAPDELTVYAGLLTFPDGTAVAALIPCYCGDLAEGERLIQPLRDFGSPIMDTVQPMAFPALQSMLDASYPNGNHNYWKSAMFADLSDQAIDVIVKQANRMTSPLSSIVIGCYGGAMSRVGPSETAFPHRTELWDIGIFPQWTDPSESATHVGWARGMSEALNPFVSGGHVISFLDQETDSVIRSAFGSNHGRLAMIKKNYDPSNFFRVNQNVLPST